MLTKYGQPDCIRCICYRKAQQNRPRCTRSDIKDFDEVVRLDMSYVDNWSLGLDVKIMFKTVAAVLGHKGNGF